MQKSIYGEKKPCLEPQPPEYDVLNYLNRLYSIVQQLQVRNDKLIAIERLDLLSSELTTVIQDK